MYNESLCFSAPGDVEESLFGVLGDWGAQLSRVPTVCSRVDRDKGELERQRHKISDLFRV